MPLALPRLKTSLRILAVAALTFALNGCVNLDDAAGLSKLSEHARLALPRVSNDVAATCARQNTLLANTPAGERPPSIQPQDCKPYQELARHLALDQHILVGYFDALGKLSSNKPMSYAEDIHDNEVATSKSDAFSANAITASNDAQSILKSLADAVTKGYREKQLGEFIQANDPAIQSLTQALKKVITVDYALLLSNEELSLDAFYQAPMASSQSGERLALILVQRQYANDKTALQSRKDAILSYGRIMDDIGSLHAKLKQQAGRKVSMIDIAKEIGPTVASLQNAISDLQSRSN
ncbi:MAG TPA: hypothetical protein VK627_01745 [Edaphobacter sp.]|jgi:hypothetical protein|nr:hypothetical protein [Edaphobacter sp.]